jgi:hypothetical protein
VRSVGNGERGRERRTDLIVAFFQVSDHLLIERLLEAIQWRELLFTIFIFFFELVDDLTGEEG